MSWVVLLFAIFPPLSLKGDCMYHPAAVLHTAIVHVCAFWMSGLATRLALISGLWEHLLFPTMEWQLLETSLVSISSLFLPHCCENTTSHKVTEIGRHMEQSQVELNKTTVATSDLQMLTYHCARNRSAFLWTLRSGGCFWPRWSYLMGRNCMEMKD